MRSLNVPCPIQPRDQKAFNEGMAIVNHKRQLARGLKRLRQGIARIELARHQAGHTK